MMSMRVRLCGKCCVREDRVVGRRHEVLLCWCSSGQGQPCTGGLVKVPVRQRLNCAAACGAQFLLTPGVVPARCLALRTDAAGGGAYVELDLRTPIEPLSFTYEHAPVRSHSPPAAPWVQPQCARVTILLRQSAALLPSHNPPAASYLQLPRSRCAWRSCMSLLSGGSKAIAVSWVLSYARSLVLS